MKQLIPLVFLLSACGGLPPIEAPVIDRASAEISTDGEDFQTVTETVISWKLDGWVILIYNQVTVDTAENLLRVFIELPGCLPLILELPLHEEPPAVEEPVITEAS